MLCFDHKTCTKHAVVPPPCFVQHINNNYILTALLKHAK